MAAPVVEAVLLIVEALLDHATPPPVPADGVVASTDHVTITQGDAVLAADDAPPSAADHLAAPLVSAEDEEAQYQRGVASAKAAEALLHAHMDELLAALNVRLRGKFGGDAAKALAKAGGGRQATRELRLFTRLSSHISDPAQATQLIELFLPYDLIANDCQ